METQASPILGCQRDRSPSPKHPTAWFWMLQKVGI